MDSFLQNTEKIDIKTFSIKKSVKKTKMNKETKLNIQRVIHDIILDGNLSEEEMLDPSQEIKDLMISDQEWKSMSGGQFTSNMAQHFQAANPMSQFQQGPPTVEQMIPDDRRGREVPTDVANALTKDYSALMKAINKKKGK